MPIKKNISDEELIDKLRRGDIEAFDAIFAKYGNRLFGFALKYLKLREDAEGLVQDVFIKIWENREKLKKESSLKSYLFTISYHNICKFFRKKQLRGKLIEELGLVSDISMDTEEQIDYYSTLEQIEKMIEKMPAKQKTIFLKSRKDGKSTREIAEEMHLAPGTVDNHISAALKFIRKHISNSNLPLILFSLFFC